MSEVKKTRRDKSEATRQKILKAAKDEFVGKGFHGATIASIAERAGVASQTVYFVFHNKIDLMSAVIDAAVMGDEAPVRPEGSDWWKAAVAEPDAAGTLRIFIRGSAPIYSRASAVSAALRAAAATDDDLRGAWNFHEKLRHDSYEAFMTIVASKGALREGLDLASATDLFLTLFSDMTYQLMTVDRGWPAERFIEWLCDALPRELLADD